MGYEFLQLIFYTHKHIILYFFNFYMQIDIFL
jgi:hypothetical protein